jgi:hypothetical protein
MVGLFCEKLFDGGIDTAQFPDVGKGGGMGHHSDVVLSGDLVPVGFHAPEQHGEEPWGTLYGHPMLVGENLSIHMWSLSERWQIPQGNLVGIGFGDDHGVGVVESPAVHGVPSSRHVLRRESGRGQFTRRVPGIATVLAPYLPRIGSDHYPLHGSTLVAQSVSVNERRIVIVELLSVLATE